MRKDAKKEEVSPSKVFKLILAAHKPDDENERQDTRTTNEH